MISCDFLIKIFKAMALAKYCLKILEAYRIDLHPNIGPGIRLEFLALCPFLKSPIKLLKALIMLRNPSPMDIP